MTPALDRQQRTAAEQNTLHLRRLTIKHLRTVLSLKASGGGMKALCSTNAQTEVCSDSRVSGSGQGEGGSGQGLWGAAGPVHRLMQPSASRGACCYSTAAAAFRSTARVAGGAPPVICGSSNTMGGSQPACLMKRRPPASRRHPECTITVSGCQSDIDSLRGSLLPYY